MDLTETERKVFEKLPRPPQSGSAKKPTIIWIVEWLSPDDQRTGGQLHEWVQKHCTIKSKYFVCRNKKEVISTIERASLFAGNDTIPLLHIEAHGDEGGLEGPNRVGDLETLTWEELTVPLQQLNLHTRCNLVVFIAACTGGAGIKVFFKGPLAPAVALVGPVAPISPSDLLNGTKEFYRRLRDKRPHLDKMVDSASTEVGTTLFELEPFVVLAFEAFAEQLIDFKSTCRTASPNRQTTGDDVHKDSILSCENRKTSKNPSPLAIGDDKKAPTVSLGHNVHDGSFP